MKADAVRRSDCLAYDCQFFRRARRKKPPEPGDMGRCAVEGCDGKGCLRWNRPGLGGVLLTTETRRLR